MLARHLRINTVVPRLRGWPRCCAAITSCHAKRPSSPTLTPVVAVAHFVRDHDDATKPVGKGRVPVGADCCGVSGVDVVEVLGRRSSSGSPSRSPSKAVNSRPALATKLGASKRREDGPHLRGCLHRTSAPSFARLTTGQRHLAIR
jgi:hypothetical protein